MPLGLCTPLRKPQVEHHAIYLLSFPGFPSGVLIFTFTLVPGFPAKFLIAEITSLGAPMFGPPSPDPLIKALNAKRPGPLAGNGPGSGIVWNRWFGDG
jgi:hypothetical protein